MRVIAADHMIVKESVKVMFYNTQFINFDIETEPLQEVLKHSDFITLHVPARKKVI